MIGLACLDDRARLLPQAEDLPPRSADAEPDEEVVDGEDASKGVPLVERDVAGSKDRRGGSNSVGGEAAHDVGEHSKAEGGHQRWGPAGHGDAQESGVHGTDVGRTARKEVVRVVVEQHDDQEGWLPGESPAPDNADDLLGEPRDQSELVQAPRHGDQGGEPGEGIPGPVLVQALLPADDPGHQEDGEPGERSGNGVDSVVGTKDPHGHRGKQGDGHDFLVPAHGSELGELLLGLGWGLGAVLDLRRVDDVKNQGHGDQAHEARHEGGHGPLGP
mmetsp:Transcript_6981/g.20410  ORF Transcript_6981/g.20410 Transcript_6981/m.20410 type:complete len:274 (-) Transcript_6981:971-1792(-)